MKNLNPRQILIFLCMAIIANLNAQPKWKYSSMSAISQHSKLYFNQSIPYGTKQNTIITGIVGGIGWTSYKMGNHVPSDQSIVDVSKSASSLVGYALSSNGVVLKTINNGNDWVPVYTFPATCKQIKMVNDSVVYAIQEYNGVIYKTTDGGFSWNFKTLTNNDFIDMHFFDTNKGWVLDNNKIIHQTNDGGKTWATKQSPGSSMLRYNKLENELWVIGSSNTGKITLYRSKDEGSTWSLMDSSGSNRLVEFVPALRNSEVGWKLTQDGEFSMSRDGGRTWTTYASTALNGIRLVHFAMSDFNASQNGVALDLQSNYYNTSDSGKTWTVSAHGADHKVMNTNTYALSIANANSAFSVNNSGTCMRTNNRGINWSPIYTNVRALFGCYFNNTAKNGAVVGNIGRIAITSDSGVTWQDKSINTQSAFYDITFTNQEYIAIGASGLIRKGLTQSNWASVTSGTTQVLRSISFPSNNIGYIVGHGGVMLKSTNGGNSWQALSSPTTVNLIKVVFINDTVGIAVGLSGTMILTTNGGTAWTTIQTGVSEHFLSAAYNNGTWWITGNGGNIYSKTGNGPFTFEGSFVGSNPINAIGFFDNRTGFAFSNSGFVLEYDYDCSFNQPSASSLAPPVNLDICAGDSTNLFASGKGKLLWYQTNTSTTAIGEGARFQTPSLQTSTMYYVLDSLCNAGPRTPISVSVSGPKPTISTSQDSRTLCRTSPTSSTRFIASASAGKVYWYDDLPFESILYVGDTFRIPPPVGDGVYYFRARAENGGCKSDKLLFALKVINRPKINEVTNDSVCKGEPARLILEGSGERIGWYNDTTSGIEIYSGDTFITPALSSQRIFYAKSIEDVCSSEYAYIPALVKPLPDVEVTKFADSSLQVAQSNAMYQWLDCQTLLDVPNATSKVFTPMVTGNYAVKVNLNGCRDTSECISVTVIPNALNELNADNVSIYPNPTSAILNIDISPISTDQAVVVLKDIKGSVLFEKQINQFNTQIDLSEITSGTYLLTISGSHTFLNRKIQIIK